MAENDPANDSEGHDAQRALEQKALRNVRGLVDRMQADDEKERRSRKWIVGVLAAVIALLGAIVLYSVSEKPGSGREIVVSPAPKAPSR